jgi:hypothetical protein
MLDGDSKQIIAEGRAQELHDQSADPRVHAFFNREPSLSFRRRTESGHRSA